MRICFVIHLLLFLLIETVSFQKRLGRLVTSKVAIVSNHEECIRYSPTALFSATSRNLWTSSSSTRRREKRPHNNNNNKKDYYPDDKSITKKGRSNNFRKQPKNKKPSINNNNSEADRFNKQLKSMVYIDKTQQRQMMNHYSDRRNGNNNLAEQAEEALFCRIQSGQPYDTKSFNIVLNAWAQQRCLSAARRADDLLEKLLQLQQNQPNITTTTTSSTASTSSSSSSSSTGFCPVSLCADAYSYSAVLNAYAKSGGGKNAALRAEQLLQQMERSITLGANNDFCHNAVMNAWSTSGDPQAGQRAEQWLRQLKHPTRISYNACIKAYARSKQPHEAQRLLDKMIELSSEEKEELLLEPDKISISTCIHAWAQATEDLTFAATQAEKLLTNLETRYINAVKAAEGSSSHTKSAPEERISRLRPDIVSYTSVLSAYAKSGSPDAPTKAFDLVQRLERYASQKPNVQFWNTLIHLYSKMDTTKTTRTSSPFATATASTTVTTPYQTAEAILRYMKASYEKSGDIQVRPDKITYTAIISVHANRGTIAGAERAEELLNELEYLYETTGENCYLPNVKTFASVLSAWAKAGATSSSILSSEYGETFLQDRAFALLKRMESLYKETNNKEELRPNSIVYSQVLRILATSNDDNAASLAMGLLRKMKDLHKKGYHGVLPDATTYAYLVNTFTKSNLENVPELASCILEEVEDGYHAGMGNLKPTSLLYSAVLQAYAKDASKKGAKLAEQLLERTKTLYKQGKMYAKPTNLYYNAVMDAHARSNGGQEAAERAEELLEEMETRCRAGDSELRLTTRSYNAAIFAWKNSNVTDAPQRAESLLKRMSGKYKAGDKTCRPDRVTINSIIGVWAKSQQDGAAERAENFLRFMEKMYKDGDTSLKPDSFSYNTVIDAYARCGSADRAQDLYERMRDLYESGGNDDLRPDDITLTSLRNAWRKISTTSSSGEDYTRALEQIQKIDEMLFDGKSESPT